MKVPEIAEWIYDTLSTDIPIEWDLVAPEGARYKGMLVSPDQIHEESLKKYMMMFEHTDTKKCVVVTVEID